MSQQQSEEERARAAVFAGHNVFLTGGAGVGKTHMLHQLIRDLRARGDKVCVTASTGIAATALSGTTIHAAMGMGLCDGPIDKLLKRARMRRYLSRRWQSIDVLVIDEISMVDPVFFERCDALLQQFRACPKPFGGLQVVVSGDFLQLPPVKSEKKRLHLKQSIGSVQKFRPFVYKQCTDKQTRHS